MKHGYLKETLLALLMACAPTAQAGLIGSMIDVSTYFPTSSDLFSSGGTETVSTAVEYPAGTYFDYNLSWEVDVSDNQLTITDTLDEGFPFGDAPFNGFILTIISGPTLVSASANASSGFFPFDISIVGGNQLLLNYQGVGGAPGELSSIIDIRTDSTIVPEPTSFLLFAIGLAGFAVGGCRRGAPAAASINAPYPADAGCPGR